MQEKDFLIVAPEHHFQYFGPSKNWIHVPINTVHKNYHARTPRVTTAIEIGHIYPYVPFDSSFTDHSRKQDGRANFATQKLSFFSFLNRLAVFHGAADQILLFFL